MKKGSKVYWRRLFKSYIIVLAIILVVIMAVGLYLNKIQRQELLSEETSIISSYAEEKERKVDALVQLQRQMLENSIVRQYVANAYKSKEETAYIRREVNTYLSELYDNFYYREEIEDIFVYFDKTDIAISGVYGSLELTDYAKTHILQNYNSTDVEIAAIRDNIIIEEKGRPRFFVYSNGGKECIGISMRYYSVQERWMSNCCAVILLGTRFFDGYAGEITSDSKVGIAIDSYPYILFSSEDNIEWTPEKQDFQKVQIIDKNRARLEKSERYPFTYVLMNNHNEYSWELYRFSVILYLIVLFLCFLFVYISIQVANYIYRPIELLLSGLTDKLQTGDYRNINSKYDEFFVLDNVLKKYDNTLYELEKEKSYTKEQLKGIYLTKFMLGTFTEDEKEKILKDIGWDDNGIYAVILISREKIRDNLKNDLDKALEYFIYKNVFEEILQSKGTGYLQMLGENLYVLIAKINQMQEGEKILEQLLLEANIFLEEHYSFSHTIYVGGLVESVELLSSSYVQAQEVLQYKLWDNNNRVIYYKDVSRHAEIKTYMSKDIEQDLYDAVQEMEIWDFDVYVDKILKKVIKGNCMYAKDFYMFASFMAISLQRFLEKFGVEDKLDSVYRIANAESIDEVRKTLGEILVQCRIYYENRKREDSLAYRVNKYIEECYTDSGLSIASLTTEFGVSQSHLSKAVKVAYGKTILEIIGDTRLKAVKEYLLNTEMSLEEIANKTGFLSANSLIRFFKTKEGITPGGYRKSKHEG